MVQGFVYLIHFEKKYYHAQHYIGWARNVEKRMVHHRNGSGSKLLAHLNKIGIKWEVVMTKKGTGDEERRMKKCKKARSFCPVCKNDKTNL
jgi:predicted GIY-YIG superfamily endonuclease